MKNEKPLAISQDIVNTVCEPIMCASQATDPAWKRVRALEVDELVRPLVDALTAATPIILCAESMRDGHRMKVWREAIAALKKAKGETDEERKATGAE